MAIESKPRAEMDARWQWRLNDIIASDAAFETLFEETRQMVKAFERFEGKVADEPREAVKESFGIQQSIEKLYAFAVMKRDEDAENNTYQALAARAQTLAVSAQSASAFLRPELLKLPDETFQGLIKDPAMADYSTYLKDLLRDKPHTLPFEQEKLLAMAGDALDAPQTAFSMLDNVDMPFPMVKNDEGEDVRLSHAKYGTLIRSKHREVRKEAFNGMMNSFKAFASTVSALYAGSVKGDVFTARARRFDSALAASLHPDEVPTAVYENLLAAVHDALPDLNRYLALRKKVLNVDELHLYDLYVPMVDDVKMDMDYPEAFKLVLSALAPLGDDYLDTLKKAYNEGWIDVYENKSKRSGAYSWGCHGVHPFVLLNFEKGLDGASTLAHELGHAMHSFYSDGAQPYAKAGYSLFVAEVASTCNEVLLAKYLMNKYKDDKKTLAFLLNDLLESFRTTLFRQTLFAEFEKASHAMAEKDEALTKESLSAVYKEINAKYYGGECVIDEEIASEWMRIPHFYTAFYVYKYATGFSAAVAIASRILKEGAPAVKDYKNFLSAGGSVPPIEALKYAGVDMGSEKPVRDALKVFADTVTELEGLLK